MSSALSKPDRPASALLNAGESQDANVQEIASAQASSAMLTLQLYAHASRRRRDFAAV
ncbi:MAG TPA: hypothetical protein PKJ50_10305 [Casimicrobium huifangae]|nr:hypothetical protein [Casimicrobium huifangae]